MDNKDLRFTLDGILNRRGLRTDPLVTFLSWDVEFKDEEILMDTHGRTSNM